MVAFALIFAVACAILFQFCNRKLIHEEQASTVLSFMYLFCGATAGVAVLWFGIWQINWIVFMLGIVNAIAAWSFFRALSQSLVKTILFLPLTRVVALVCAAIFLHEWNLFNPNTTKGLSLLIGTFITLSSISFFGNKTQSKMTKGNWSWFLAGFVLLTGFLDFLTKYFADSGLPLSQFLFSWYLGALLGSILPRLLEKNFKFRIMRAQWKWYLGLSTGTLGSLVGIYWGLQLAPAALIFPVHAFGYAFGSVLLGLFVFHERNEFGKKEWFGVYLGAFGTLLIITGIY